MEWFQCVIPSGMKSDYPKKVFHTTFYLSEISTNKTLEDRPLVPRIDKILDCYQSQRDDRMQLGASAPRMIRKKVELRRSERISLKVKCSIRKRHRNILNLKSRFLPLRCSLNEFYTLSWGCLKSHFVVYETKYNSPITPSFRAVQKNWNVIAF